MSEEYVSRKEVRDRVLSLSLKRFELSDAYKVYVEAIKNAGMEIARTPAADVVPVVHGKWKSGIGENGVTKSLFCSVCHYENKHWYEWYYCPNCGAKMDGGKNV